MNAIYDYKRFAVLYVDDEEKSLKYFTRAFANTFRVYTAPNAAEGFKILQDHQDEIGVVMSDQRMPGEQGVQFLERARRLQPRIIRILATAFADLDAAVAAVNNGAVYKYVQKPWDLPGLETTLKRSLEFFIVQMERDLLLREKLSSLHRMLIADRVLSLGVLAAGLGSRLRNTLEAVHRFLDLAPEMLEQENVDMEQLRNPDFWERFHRRVRDQVKTVFTILDDLGPEAHRPFTFDTMLQLRPVLAATLEKLGPELAEHRVRVTNDIPADLPPVQADGTRFHKLFELLLRDEMLKGLPELEVRFAAVWKEVEGGGEGEVELQVWDNGLGVPPEAVLSVLDPLVSRGTRADDLGLNLMACYFIVYHHGGRIRVQPGGPGQSCLVITLPVRPPTTGPDPESAEFLIRAMTNERLWERLQSGV